MKRVSKVMNQAKAKLSTVNCQLSIILMMSAAVVVSSCTKDKDEDNTVPVTDITLTPAAQTLAVGGANGQLTATITPDNATDQEVKWSIEPLDVAIIGDDGSLIAIKEGEATVTATAGGKTASATVTVRAAFPDANFRAYVMENFDTDNNGVISATEAAAVKSINCVEKDISSLEGIEVFTALTHLQCTHNQLTTLDVSRNTALTQLYCSVNPLTTLDVSKNTALNVLDCSSNQLTALDVSNNTALTYLQCSLNPLATLDVSKNTALTYLQCNFNQLETLDVSKNTKLTDLICIFNQLTTLDVSNNTKLTYLDCTFNKLTALDVSNNTVLTELYSESNQLTAAALDALFNSLPTATGNATIAIANNPGTDACNKSIAEDKGWTIP